MADPANSNAPALSADQVRHNARLARLNPSNADIERYREQLASILAHVACLGEVNIEGVEPLHQPSIGPESINRLDHDEPQPPLAIESLARMAPAMEGRCVAVPKVIAEDA